MSIIALNNCNFGCVLKGHILQGTSQFIECHSVTRKLSSDGKVDTTQTLHNLNEDFEKAWEGNSQGHLTGWSDGFSAPAKAGSGTSEQMGVAVKNSWRLPYREQARNMGNQGANTESRTTSGGRTKKVVRINIE
ncbi:uncharacterized protein [Gossypium hirsutum]|uniref:Uncharacterized protein isoform X2 n=1 Tax=Gossypium hirsutum TaxID=3635 RepID=A0ABM3B3W1_GOSHI|nr:uncharacterized protein LOC107911585 isoform X2 [Gossypium hirsutum]